VDGYRSKCKREGRPQRRRSRYNRAVIRVAPGYVRNREAEFRRISSLQYDMNMTELKCITEINDTSINVIARRYRVTEKTEKTTFASEFEISGT
jgi:hypothetical protein